MAGVMCEIRPFETENEIYFPERGEITNNTKLSAGGRG
jgi:hypothetical protein